jgi:dipeptidyl aminopeptidase/acylaminoacyl peptidase
MQARSDRGGYLPDPRDLLATPPSELYVIPIAGGRARQITRLGVDVTRVAWDSTSGRLAFVADLDQRDEHSYEHHDLWVVERDGGVTQITDDEFVYGAPAWMPDGGSVIVRRYEGLDSVIGRASRNGAAIDLFQVSLTGGAAANLTADWDLRPGAPSVDAAGTIRFAANIGGESHLFELSPGAPVRQVTTGRRWLSAFSIDAAGQRIAYVGTTASRPSELFVADADGGSEAKITRHNEVLLSQVLLAAALRQQGRPAARRLDHPAARLVRQQRSVSAYRQHARRPTRWLWRALLVPVSALGHCWLWSSVHESSRL